MNDFVKIKNLENAKNIESANVFEYPKLKDINIPKEKRWNKEIIGNANTKYFDLGGDFEKSKDELFIQPK